MIDQLHIADSGTVLLFSKVLQGVGRNLYIGKKKGGLEIPTLMQASEDVPCPVNMTAAAQHDHSILSKIKLPVGSWLVFGKL